MEEAFLFWTWKIFKASIKTGVIGSRTKSEIFLYFLLLYQLILLLGLGAVMVGMGDIPILKNNQILIRELKIGKVILKII